MGDLSEQLPNSVSGEPNRVDTNELDIGPTVQEFDGGRENIPVEVESVELSRTGKFNNKYRPVPGGCQLWDQEGWFGGGSDDGTTATPIYSSELGKHVMLTAAHIYDSEGDAVQQPKYNSFIENNRIGEINQRKKYGNFDVATIDVDLNQDSNVIYRLACDYYNDCWGAPIRGYIGKDELKDNVNNSDYIIRKQGRTTGMTKGEIAYIEETNYGNNPDHPVTRLWINANAEAGDSGGPHYRLIDEANGTGAYIAGVHAWIGGGKAISTTMTSILSELQVDWVN
jgi:hypothetical protein